MYRLVADEIIVKETEELSLAVAEELKKEDPDNAEEIINEDKNTERND